MNKRGVSPVIAVILMVALTTVLSGVLYVWVTSIAAEEEANENKEDKEDKESSIKSKPPSEAGTFVIITLIILVCIGTPLGLGVGYGIHHFKKNKYNFKFKDEQCLIFRHCWHDTKEWGEHEHYAHWNCYKFQCCKCQGLKVIRRKT